MFFRQNWFFKQAFSWMGVKISHNVTVNYATTKLLLEEVFLAIKLHKHLQ
jgi:hypothetical protein